MDKDINYDKLFNGVGLDIAMDIEKMIVEELSRNLSREILKDIIRLGDRKEKIKRILDII
jgi:hypothetical protein